MQANILIDELERVRITDFGFSTIFESQSFASAGFASMHHRGSAQWMAPELLMSHMRKTKASDVYAFGMTILEVSHHNVYMYVS